MSIIKIASFGYEIFVVLSRTQSIYNVRSFRQIRVNNVLFVVQYLTKKRIISKVLHEENLPILT